MKRENVNRLFSLSSEINETERILDALYKDQNNIALIVQDGSRTLTTIGAWESCEHHAKEVALLFKRHLIVHYELRLQDQLKELETL